jgi:hypothetical protein
MTDETAEGKKPARPNAALPLTENDPEKGMVFHYSRERRLENAPPEVKALYRDSANPPRFNLLRPLIATRSLAVLFVSMLVLAAITIALSFYTRADESSVLEGNRISVSALRFDGGVILMLKKTIQKSGAYTGTVGIAVSPVRTEGTETIAAEPYRVTFTLKDEEEYRFALPFEDEDLLVHIQGAEESLDFKIKTK